MDDKLPIFSHSDALAVALIDHADAFGDDAGTHAAVTRQRAAADALAEARRTLANARRVPGYPTRDLATLEARVTRADAEAQTVEGALTAAKEARLTRARRVRGAALTAALSRPAGVDPAADRAEQQRLTERIERDIEAGERALMLKTSAKDNTNLALIRAALTAPQPAWPTAKWQPLVTAADAEEIREWLIAHRAPETVKDVKAAWRLGRLAQELALARQGHTMPHRTPSLEELGARVVGGMVAPDADAS